MVSLRSGAVLKDGNSNVNGKKTATKSQQPPSKKRKTQDALPVEENKENVDRSSTPTPAKSKVYSEPSQHEKTPGRVGPIKKESFDCKPDIKPFKGPPWKKVRKTASEKDQEYKQFALENDEHPFHELHVCFKKGPNGSPTYDKAGFQLDFDKVAHWTEPKAYNKGAMLRNMDRTIEKRYADQRRMAEIFFEKGEGPAEPEHANGANYWKDRVSKDLGVPWHKVQVENFEQWEKRGFKKARRGEYENFSEQERNRMTRMMIGASSRK